MRRLIAGLMCMLLAFAARAQVGEFTYQGQLTSGGAPANGPYDFRFTLFNAASGGGSISSTVCADDVPVVDGRFTVIVPLLLPTTGEAAYLDVQVRSGAAGTCAVTTGYTPLTPRQAMTRAPSAVYASAVAQRGVVVEGSLRYNSAQHRFEGFDGQFWHVIQMDQALPPDNQIVFNTPGGYTFTVPTGVTRIIVDIYGGGGGGGGLGAGSNVGTECQVGQAGFAAGGGGGGGGGAGRFAINVTPGEVLNLSVGFGGPAGTTGAGGSGTASRVRRNGNTVEVITAPAGSGGGRASSAVAMGNGGCGNGALGGAGGNGGSAAFLVGTSDVGTPGIGGAAGRGPSCADVPFPGNDQFCLASGGNGAPPRDTPPPVPSSGGGGGDGAGMGVAAQAGSPGYIKLWWN